MEHQTLLNVIRNKRDRKELTAAEIQSFVAAVGTEALSEAQIGAFLMAVYLNDISLEETANLTNAMANSGIRLEWPIEWKGTVVDKHATGGVGDKTSLVLAPALAACGLRVPMISGRSLGFTGGTLDKLESIPGFNVNLQTGDIQNALENSGCCIVSQSEEIAPADRILYRIRDATGTVENEGVITSSIISKKAAEGLDALVLDVKFGRGSFMKRVETAQSLARKLVAAGNSFGIKTSAVLSRMDSPLGYAVGNALEVAEAIDTLKGHGPADLLELVAALGGKLLKSTGHAQSKKDAKSKILEVIENGKALRYFGMMLICQGCESTNVKELCAGDKWKILPRTSSVYPLLAKSTGYLESIDALVVASVSHGVGSDGAQPHNKHAAGIVLKKKPGDAVSEGDVLMEIHHDGRDVALVLQKLDLAIKIISNQPTIPPLISKSERI